MLFMNLSKDRRSRRHSRCLPPRNKSGSRYAVSSAKDSSPLKCATQLQQTKVRWASLAEGGETPAFPEQRVRFYLVFCECRPGQNKLCRQAVCLSLWQ